jgi:hypothetical protein
MEGAESRGSEHCACGEEAIRERLSFPRSSWTLLAEAVGSFCRKPREEWNGQTSVLVVVVSSL